MADPKILHAQLQSILDMANKTFSADQSQLLAREIQKTLSNPMSGPSNPRKRKAGRCDGTNCGPGPSSMNPRMQAPDPGIPAEGRFVCDACSELVALVDETGFTLAPWVAHLPVCGQTKRAPTSAITHPVDAAAWSTSKHKLFDQSGISSAAISPAGACAEDPPTTSQSALARNNADLQFKMTKPLLSQALDPPSIVPPVPTESEAIPTLPEPPRIAETSKPPSVLPSDRHAGLHSARVSMDASFQAAFGTSIPFELFPPKQRQPNRTEAERIEEFRADPHVAEVEPYRVRCATCRKWIKLRKNSRYCSIPWNCHKASCNRTNGAPSGTLSQPSTSSASDSQQIVSLSNHNDAVSAPALAPTPSRPSVPNRSLAHPSLSVIVPPPRADSHLPPPSEHPSLQSGTPPPSSTWTDPSTVANGSGALNFNPTLKAPRRARLADAEQRRAALEADPHTEVVEPDRIMCALCKKWVKLRPNSSYCSAPWQSHIQRCVPRRRRQEALKTALELGTSSMKEPPMWKHLASDSSAASGGDADPDKRKSSYYRKNYENAFNDGQIRASYYKMPPVPSAVSTSQGSSMSGLPVPRRRGRPPKNRVPDLKPDCSAERSDSEMSYESEEE